MDIQHSELRGGRIKVHISFENEDGEDSLGYNLVFPESAFEYGTSEQ